MNSILFSLFADSDLSEKIINGLNCERGEIVLHQFPDEENAITIKSNVKDKNVILLVDLNRPNQKIITLVFFAELAKELGAKKITLVAPYLAYMRQDKQFNPGEGISSKYFAQLISHYFDFLITIDPHLHRFHTLNEIYTIPGVVLHATKQIARWIKANVADPIIVGPDNESRQWAEEIAKDADASFVILQKTRNDDRSVAVKLPDLKPFKNKTPVLIDDIISTGVTMVEAVKELRLLNMKPTVCIAVHGVFAEEGYQYLLSNNVSRVVTCNTIKHVTNEIDISELIVDYF